MSKKSSKFTIKKFFREAIIFTIAIFVVSTALNLYRAPKLDNNYLPTIKTKLADGSVFDSKSASGKPLLINFWGTWCPVCAAEAGNIAYLSKDYNVITIAVNSGSNDDIKKWLDKKGVSYPVINDTSALWADKFKVSVYPTTFIYDSNGKLKFTETGYSTTAGLIARMKLAE